MTTETIDIVEAVGVGSAADIGDQQRPLNGITLKAFLQEIQAALDTTHKESEAGGGAFDIAKLSVSASVHASFRGQKHPPETDAAGDLTFTADALSLAGPGSGPDYEAILLHTDLGRDHTGTAHDAARRIPLYTPSKITLSLEFEPNGRRGKSGTRKAPAAAPAQKNLFAEPFLTQTGPDAHSNAKADGHPVKPGEPVGPSGGAAMPSDGSILSTALNPFKELL